MERLREIEEDQKGGCAGGGGGVRGGVGAGGGVHTCSIRLDRAVRDVRVLLLVRLDREVDGGEGGKAVLFLVVHHGIHVRGDELTLCGVLVGPRAPNEEHAVPWPVQSEEQPCCAERPLKASRQPGQHSSLPGSHIRGAATLVQGFRFNVKLVLNQII